MLKLSDALASLAVGRDFDDCALVKLVSCGLCGGAPPGPQLVDESGGGAGDAEERPPDDGVSDLAAALYHLTCDADGDYIGDVDSQGPTYPDGHLPAESLCHKLQGPDTGVFVNEVDILVPPARDGYVYHQRADKVVLPKAQMFTDFNACMMDSFNCLVGERIATRDACGEPHLAISWGRLAPIAQGRGFEVSRVHTNGRGACPRMAVLMQQQGKLFLVEYAWRHPIDDTWDYHVVGVDTVVRAVFCNTLGILPFAVNEKCETSATHLSIINDMLRVHRVLKVWCLCSLVAEGGATLPSKKRKRKPRAERKRRELPQVPTISVETTNRPPLGGGRIDHHPPVGETPPPKRRRTRGSGRDPADTPSEFVDGAYNGCVQGTPAPTDPAGPFTVVPPNTDLPSGSSIDAQLIPVAVTPLPGIGGAATTDGSSEAGQRVAGVVQTPGRGSTNHPSSEPLRNQGFGSGV